MSYHPSTKNQKTYLFPFSKLETDKEFNFNSVTVTLIKRETSKPIQQPLSDGYNSIRFQNSINTISNPLSAPPIYSRPFLHEGNGNVTITPTQLDYRPKSASVASKPFTPGSVRLHRILQREAASSAPAGQIQRRAAQRKLQMAKMLSNGGLSAVALNFQRNHHDNSQNQNDPLFVASRRARSNNFTLKETFDLLKIWASPEMQWQMKHNFRNFRVWEAISFAMHESGHDRTAIQCKNRIQNLTSIFYRIKKSKQDYRTFNFPYYKLIGDVLDGKKNISSSINPSTAMSLSNSAFLKNNNSGVTISPSQNSTAGFAAHMALVEEYQHLINGNPEVYITPAGGHSSSNNSNSGLNVLSPEVSLSEGDSPIRVENQASRSSTNPASQASSSKDTPKSSIASINRNGSVNPAALLKVETEDSVTVTVTEDPNNSENEKYDNENDMDNSDLEDNMLGQLNDSLSEGNDGFPAARTKRSFSANYAPYGKASFTSGLGNGNAAKRPRGASTATNASSNPDDQIGAYLAEMIDIERQWLDMERERAENERSMMMYMMQILQALVCPGQSQDENDDEEINEENENDGMDGESPENENEDDNENEENEIHQMIEQEENNMDDGEDGDPDE